MNPEDKEERLAVLVDDMRRQHMDPWHCRTVGPCSTPGCRERAVGSAKCPNCLTRELTKLVGGKLALEFRAAVHGAQDVLYRMHDVIDVPSPTGP